MKTFDLNSLIRPNIKKLVPYAAARHLTTDASIFMDANENPYNNGFNRYPDPWQNKLKKRIGKIKMVSPDSVFIGNGSDEIIDLLIRIFCEPGKDNIIITPPTYGMYEVSAAINNIEVIKAPLTSDFSLNYEGLFNSINQNTKIIFLCSPNNPTGNVLRINEVQQVISRFNGIVAIDEAYIDFSTSPSWVQHLNQNENLVVMQTLSKGYGLAGLRIGMAFGSLKVIELLNKVKPPYNISIANQREALKQLSNPEIFEQIEFTVLERDRLSNLLGHFSFVEYIYPSEANFILIKVNNADNIFDFLKSKGIIIRNRSTVIQCENCLRITIGTRKENDLLIDTLNQYE